MQALSQPKKVAGVVLAGGQARRMNGIDKGLMDYLGQPLISHVLTAIKPQVDSLIINANRHISDYQQFGYPVVADNLEGFQGPLAGMLIAMQSVKADYILTVPCDCPAPSPVLRQRLMETLLASKSDVAVAYANDRIEPVFCLMPTNLSTALTEYLQSGQRRIDSWLAQLNCAVVDFTDQSQYFSNINQPDDLKLTRLPCQLPVIGFAAFSGAGKTTLLTQLIPVLKQRRINVAVIKHAHHNFDIDTPGKDSYKIREAGAAQVLIASDKMSASIQKNITPSTPELAQLLSQVDQQKVELIICEGFKNEPIDKIEVYRSSLNHDRLSEQDKHIIAIATDDSSAINTDLLCLDLNNIEQIADYIEQFITQWKSST